MIEKIYEENMKDNMSEMEKLEFPELVRYCRELMGLKQYACSEYLGFEQPRYKKLELGRFAEPLESWEMHRLETFFKLPDGMLQKKQRLYLTRGASDRMAAGKSVWNEFEDTAGARSTRANGDYKRVKGEM